MKKIRKLIGFVLVSMFLFISVGCNEPSNDVQGDDVPKTGIPILIKKSSLTLEIWKGKLAESKKEVTIEVKKEQVNKIQSDECSLVVYLTNQDVYFENAAIKKISEERETEKGKICNVLISLNYDKAIDKNDEIEVLLSKKNVIAISKAFIQEDGKSKYVWKVENTFKKSDNGGQTSAKRTSEKLVNPKKVYIELGETSSSKVEIKKGLTEGDVIARQGN